MDVHEIKQKFMKLAIEYHPDKVHSENYDSSQFILIEKAYKILGNPVTKMIFDNYSHSGKNRILD